MKRKKLLIPLAIVLCCLVLLPGAAFLLIQSPAFVNFLAAALENRIGFRLHVREISIDRHLGVDLQGVEVRKGGGSPFHLLLASAQIKGKIGDSYRVEIEKIVLTHPRFVFHLKKESEEQTDLFAALEKLPPVRLLVVQDGEIAAAIGPDSFTLPGIHLSVTDFSPSGGGRMKLDGQLNVASPRGSGTGSFEAEFTMARFSPAPTGAGSIRLSLASASFGPVSLEKVSFASQVSLEGDRLSLSRTRLDADTVSSGDLRQRVVIKDARVGMDLSYDQKSGRFEVSSFEATGPGIGSLKGECAGTAKPFSWKASIESTSIDVAKVFSMVRPLLPDPYKSWTFKGEGAIEVHAEGRAENAPEWKADVLIDLKEGGFASKDNLKAGERLTGQVRLKIESSGKARKGTFDLSARAAQGELLWRTYYKDFKGESTAFSAKGAFSQSPFSLSCTGLFDLFHTGEYSFSAALAPGSDALTLEGRDVSCTRLFTLLIADYVRQNLPDLKGADVGGQSDFHVSARASGGETSIIGHFSLRDGSVHIPSVRVSLEGVQLSLPFDLTYPYSGPFSPLEGAARGSLSLDKLEAGKVTIVNLLVPLIVSHNTLLVPEQVDLPLFGGMVRLTHLRVDDMLSKNLLEAGIAIEAIDLGTLTEELSPVQVSGTVQGDLPSVSSRNGVWNAPGSITAQVFGGTVQISNIHARNLFSRARSFGGDVRFQGIDLAQLTDRIDVGKMTGIIKGTAKNLTFEYGQPSSFVLKLETDNSRPAPRSISVEAIENLSILSTGYAGVSSILNSGLHRFFKTYPYSRIGFECSLENDVFSLRGTIREGGKEYLVRRGFLRGIDVVNQNPNNSISFKDMEERVGRIFRPREPAKTSPNGA